MKIMEKDVIIIGAGPAGLAAAIRLKENGIDDVLVLEREKAPGGILKQCIHDGFGLLRFKEALSGPEYADKFIQKAKEKNVEIETGATVVRLTKNKEVTAATRNGLKKYKAKAVILSMGCRERTRGAISIPGTRPAGIFTAGVAQAYINLNDLMVGKNIIILGSGDIGLIMARRLTLEGAHVIAVFEKLPYPSGLPRNIQQCLNDYNIPLYLSYTVTNIIGKDRIQEVAVSELDENGKPIEGTEKNYKCDTLILSVGLIPENELSLQAGIELDKRSNGALVDENLQTSVPGIYSAGNVLHVHDLVDYVSLEGEKAAESVTRQLKGRITGKGTIGISTDGTIGNIVPNKISGNEDLELALRVRKPSKDKVIKVMQGEKVIKTAKLKKLNPAVMIHLNVKKEDIKSQQDIKVVVEV